MNTKFIFITGGVLSALGKGIASASIGNLLESYGYKVDFLKLDPYLNVDPGTMSPFQHGEVFVTDDGAETDLDLGHYERFTTVRTSQKCNHTSGKIYHNVIMKEREGDYLGKTVQVVPHITDEIIQCINKMADNGTEIVLVEIGGTVGDIEGLPFLEAIRQFGLEHYESDTLFIHLTLVPFIKTAGELKTKPTQHSVKSLREIGIQPDVLVCRSEIPLPDDIKKKIAMFTNLKEQNVVSGFDTDNVYKIPLIYKEQGLGKLILKKLDLEKREDNMKEWAEWIKKCENVHEEVTISIVGKYMKFSDTYKSLYEALYHSGVKNNVKINFHYVESDKLLEWNLKETFAETHGILIPGGFGDRGIEGMIKAVEYARLNDIPCFGICLGMQIMCIEYAKNAAGIKNVHSAEFNSNVKNKLFLKLKELTDTEAMGHNMRLGDYSCILKKDSIARKAYNKETILERHRHRYEFNREFEPVLEEAGLLVSGKNSERDLVEIVELKTHPWYLGCQFHPEFKSRPLEPHPIFVSFIHSARELKLSQKNK